VGDPTKVGEDHKILNSISTIRCDCDCAIAQDGLGPAPNNAIQLVGIVFRRAHVINTCLKNAHNALCNRHLRAAQYPIERYPATDTSFLRLVLHQLREEYHTYLHVVPGDEWHERWNREKIRAIETSIAEDDPGVGELKSHIKREVYREKVVGKMPTKARLIQAHTNLRAAFEVAHCYHAWAHALKVVSAREHVIEGIVFRVRYASGLSHDDIGDLMTEWESERQNWPYTVYYERDGVNWDASRQTPVFQHLIEIYSAIDPVLGQHAAGGVNCVGFVRIKKQGGIKYTVRGTRKSGHQDTSSGNSADNLESTLQTVLLARKVTGAGIRRVEGLVLGDDLLLLLCLDHMIDVTALETALIDADKASGIEPEARCLTNVFDVSFISLSFYPRFDGTIAAGPKIGRVLSGLFWTHRSVTYNECPKYQTAVAQAFLPLYGDCPLVGTVLKRHTHPKLVASGYAQYLDPNGYWLAPLAQRGGVDWHQYFMCKYGLLPGWEQSVVRSIKHDFCVLQTAVTDVIIDNDLADLPDRPLWGK
jgi:hypothetical protein